MEPKVFLCIQTDVKTDTRFPYFLIEQIDTMNGPRYRVAGRFDRLDAMKSAVNHPTKIEDIACAKS